MGNQDFYFIFHIILYFFQVLINRFVFHYFLKSLTSLSLAIYMTLKPGS